MFRKSDQDFLHKTCGATPLILNLDIVFIKDIKLFVNEQ